MYENRYCPALVTTTTASLSASDTQMAPLMFSVMWCGHLLYSLCPLLPLCMCFISFAVLLYRVTLPSSSELIPTSTSPLISEEYYEHQCYRESVNMYMQFFIHRSTNKIGIFFLFLKSLGNGDTCI